jgi:coatomer subunit beta'
LRYNAQAYAQFIESGGDPGEEGVEDAFEFITEVSESVKTGTWAGDCFIYSNNSNRINYLVGTETYTISHFDKPMYLLGYAPRDNRIYMADRDVNIYSYGLSLTVIQYQTAILRGDLEAASTLFPSIPENQRGRVARFLESQDLKELALEVTTDVDQQFDLAIQLGKLDIASKIAHQLDSEPKWRSLGDVALSSWNFKLAEECLKKANDISGLLLFYTANNNRAGIRTVAEMASKVFYSFIFFITISLTRLYS